MLVIRADLVDAMVAHARADHPDEACGVIAGPEGADRPERFIAMLNAERSPTFYRFDSGGTTQGVARPRRGRRRSNCHLPLAYRDGGVPEPHRHLLCVRARRPLRVVSTRDPDEHELRSYRIVDGVVTEEPVNIVEQY